MKTTRKLTLPGPKGKAILAKDQRFMSPSYTRCYPLVVDHASGMKVWDVDGNEFLDFTAGVAVCSTGHCHPEVVAAINDQSKKFLHMAGTDFYYAPQSDLAAKLSDIAPMKGGKRIFFTNSGTETTEAAFKLARWYKKRPRMLAFLGGFHGRTFGALSLSASKPIQRNGFAPLVPEVTHVPYPNPYRPPLGNSRTTGIECVKFIEDVIFHRSVPPEEVAACIVEPIQGEGGYVVPPDDFWPALKKLLDKHGILLIVDEIQSGMGRTGKMFAIEHTGIEPDIVCVAKGIASGLPMGAMISREELHTWKAGAHANTFGGNPVACCAALKTIDLIEHGMMANAAKVGAYLKNRLHQLALQFDIVGDVRGRGLMIGMEIVKNHETREPFPQARDAIVDSAFYHGLLIIGCGESTIRFCPPLICSTKDVDAALPILADAIRHAAKGKWNSPKVSRARI
ncbi:MAG: acetyl ornithine aminotransferase family protein [Planctomycetes bacterium]|nr:acetyl ornithine aminotransferase family protein [Planctomycetota bacterium]